MNILYNITTKYDLAKALNITLRDLTYVLYVKYVDNYYESFQIEKKTGGYRTIHAPKGELKYIQKQLSTILEKSLNTSSNVSHGFQKEKSIYTNASIHRNKRFVLNIDLSDFFDAFHFGRVRGFLMKNKDFLCTKEIATVVSQLTCYKGKLPQGAPSSPVLTNLICGSLDYRIRRLAKKYKVDFTRYADDITFSTNNIYFLRDYNDFMDELRSLVYKSGFSINEKKTRLQFRDSRQEVTGVVVNKTLNAPREYYKKTRAMAYNYYMNQECYIDGNLVNLKQIEGRFNYINLFDKLNNIKYFNNTLIYERYKPTKRRFKKYLDEFNSRECDFRQFIFYRYFYMNDKPLIITEGKTDILYLKAALKALSDDYLDLYGNYEYKVSFFKRSDRNRYMLGIEKDGGDNLKQFYINFFKDNKFDKSNFDYFTKFGYFPKNPVIILLDNEMDSSHPLGKFLAGNNRKKLVDQLEKEKFIRLNDVQNVYLTTIPKNSRKDKNKFEIEDLFEDCLLNMELNGKKFNRNGKEKGYFSKNALSKYIISNYEIINFDNFKALFDVFRMIIKDYQEWLDKSIEPDGNRGNCVL